MKIGILDFRYGHSKNFAERLRRKGSYSINLGDWIQSLAVQKLVESIGVPPGEIVEVDRDSLASYSGPPVRLIMNACFLEHSFPLPEQVEPVFIGFQTSSRELIEKHLDFFKRHQPIGCRDNSTREHFRNAGVDAYVTGCLTMTLPSRTEQPTDGKCFFIGGDGPGKMPKGLKRHRPPAVVRSSVDLYQREQVTSFPLSDQDAGTAKKLASGLLDQYRKEAALVVTPLLHAAGPSLAMGIPVILARKDSRDRFTAINRVLPLYTPDTFEAIDWEPQAVGLDGLKECLKSLLARSLEGEVGPTVEQRQTLALYYEKEPILTPEMISCRDAHRNLPLWKKLLRRWR